MKIFPDEILGYFPGRRRIQHTDHAVWNKIAVHIILTLRHRNARIQPFVTRFIGIDKILRRYIPTTVIVLVVIESDAQDIRSYSSCRYESVYECAGLSI